MLLLFAALVLAPSLAAPHSADTHERSDAPPTEKGGAGIVERLGARIPLDLTFRDETGKPVKLSDLVTVPTVILPVYYSCTNVCSFLQGGLASALPAVKRVPGREYRVISVSFDETETPAMAAGAKRIYLASMNAPFPTDGWRFLTGDAANIRRLTDAAGFHFQRKGRDFIHPVVSFVVGRDGTIVRYLYGTNFLPKDLALALLEARSGTAGAAIRTVVGYCFSFDPSAKTYVFKVLRVSATVVFLTAGSFLAFLFFTGRKGRQYPPRES